MPKKPDSRVPSAVGAIPLVGDLVRSADAQARWMQDMLEQNTRLISQFPATMKTFNDSLERFNQTIGRLDRAVTQLEKASKNLTGPIERIAGALDPKTLRDIPETLREIPETLDALRQSLTTEALPALRAAADTQNQVALLQTTVERVMAVAADLPGAGILRRAAARSGPSEEDGAATARPKPRTRR